MGISKFMWFNLGMRFPNFCASFSSETIRRIPKRNDVEKWYKDSFITIVSVIGIGLCAPTWKKFVFVCFFVSPELKIWSNLPFSPHTINLKFVVKAHHSFTLGCQIWL